MRNWFNEFGRSFKSGIDKAYGKSEIERDMASLSDRVDDKSISDEAMAQEVLDFLVKHPEQTKDHNFQVFLSRWSDKRPGMLQILADRIGLK